MSVGSRTLEPQLDSLLAALHAQVGCAGDRNGGTPVVGQAGAPRLGSRGARRGWGAGDRAGMTGQVLVLPVVRSRMQMPAEACREQERGGLSSLAVRKLGCSLCGGCGPGMKLLPQAGVGGHQDRERPEMAWGHLYWLWALGSLQGGGPEKYWRWASVRP